mmetsp:Transcript_35444/g.81770  ORF Transcript_35444/g.81770 Transcript_35444/m.81770 type:complete len:287 (+) Transcript_35444:762-1622(+)
MEHPGGDQLTACSFSRVEQDSIRELVLPVIPGHHLNFPVHFEGLLELVRSTFRGFIASHYNGADAALLTAICVSSKASTSSHFFQVQPEDGSGVEATTRFDREFNLCFRLLVCKFQRARGFFIVNASNASAIFRAISAADSPFRAGMSVDHDCDNLFPAEVFSDLLLLVAEGKDAHCVIINNSDVCFLVLSQRRLNLGFICGVRVIELHIKICVRLMLIIIKNLDVDHLLGFILVELQLALNFDEVFAILCCDFFGPVHDASFAERFGAVRLAGDEKLQRVTAFQA